MIVQFIFSVCSGSEEHLVFKVLIYNLWCRARKSWLYCCQVLDHVHNNGNLFTCINQFHFIVSNEVSVLTLLFLLEDLTPECLL